LRFQPVYGPAALRPSIGARDANPETPTMLVSYQPQNGGLKGTVVGDGDEVPPAAVWLDLFEPTTEERQKVGRLLGAELPTRADMEEIEISSRLYQEAGSTFMTALVLANSETDHPTADVITFVLSHDKLITIRFVDPQPFQTFAGRCQRGTVQARRPETLLLGLIDVIVDRLADILERVGTEIESVSKEIFDPEATGILETRAFQSVLRRLGRKNDLTGKMRESLLTISRLLSFLTQQVEERADKEARSHIRTIVRDIQSLQDHSSYLSGKLSYLLDATLGLINIDQNNIIKIMSVAAMVFLPPTLIASIEGMNFKFMPELSWWWGYPISIALMVLSAVVPYLWFKRRGWL
jgi:magnesium transporter